MTITTEVFGEILAKYFDRNLPARIGIGLSGGPDSMLVTYLLKEFNQQRSPRNRIEVHAITIDHNYRRGSTEEARSLTAQLEKWGVNHVVKTLDYGNVDPRTISNFEEVARFKRYEAINAICNEKAIPYVFLGHHNDDQVETFIQRLQGNSSIYGLACTRAISPLPTSKDLSPCESERSKPVHLARPLLSFDKSAIVEACEKYGVSFVTDITNKDPNLTRRNYLRHLFNEILPEMHSVNVESGVSGKGFRFASVLKNELSNSQGQCLDLVESFESKADTLHRQLLAENKIWEEKQFGRLSLELPAKCFLEPHNLVTSRFFYQMLYPYCTLKHYHWAYAKLERNVMPQIEQFLSQKNNPLDSCSINMMNLMFRISKIENGSSLRIEISRAPLTRDEAKFETRVTLQDTWSKWVLFDQRFWLSLRSNARPMKVVQIVPYNHKSQSQVIDADLKRYTPVQINQSLNTLPVVVIDGVVSAFPTLDLACPGVDIRWQMKENRFSYCNPKRFDSV
ncbi:uncharacterized protein LODBEIA_P41260 [Lodderomyces beijingensis]|uniref:tRNA(Ile)-lysidine synthetase n=1 Tax=Lodderomyces beijingensis TaxID=1775926 RepID=A0ABP0ZUE2_9ASCO